MAGKGNGCSFVPDHNDEVHSCCDGHDHFYQTRRISRANADQQLRECIWSTGHPRIAIIYWIGVRLFGWVPWYWRELWQVLKKK